MDHSKYNFRNNCLVFELTASFLSLWLLFPIKLSIHNNLTLFPIHWHGYEKQINTSGYLWPWDTVWSPPFSLNPVHVLVFFRNFYLFLFYILMCFLFLLLFCIIKIKCFFFTFVFLFIWMQVWSLEKEDTPHSFASRVFLQYYKFYFFLFSTLYLVSSFL